MTDTNGMAETTPTTVRDAENKVSDKIREIGDNASATFRTATERVNEAAKDGLKTAKQFAETAQKYVEQSGLAEVDVSEIIKREPWIALGVAFAVGYIAAQIMRRLS